MVEDSTARGSYLYVSNNLEVHEDEKDASLLEISDDSYQHRPPAVTNLDDPAGTPVPRNIPLARSLLLVVAFLYGTLNVALRWVYNLDGPPSASALSTARGWLAVLCFIPFLMYPKKASPRSRDASLRPLWRVALELGFLNFTSQGMINAGLLYTTAARASFLIQCSVVFTPVISSFFGKAPRRTVWLACVVALVGLAILSRGRVASTSDDGEEAEEPSKGFSLGDCLVLMGALIWSCYVYHMSAVGDYYNEIHLQALKTLNLAIFYSIWFIIASFLSPESLWPGWTNIFAWMLLLYSAAGPGTVADVLQQKGQAIVAASESNVLLSMEPVFTSILGRLLLGEATSWLEKIGGGLIVVAAVISTQE